MNKVLNIDAITHSERNVLIDMAMPYFAEMLPTIARPEESAIDRYWADPNRFPFWIRLGQMPIGFALIFRHTNRIVELAEFTTLAAYRRKGFGQAAAIMLFNRFPGRWTLGIAAQSSGAGDFWRACLLACPTAHQIIRKPPGTPFQSHSYEFTITEPEQ